MLALRSVHRGPGAALRPLRLPPKQQWRSLVPGGPAASSGSGGLGKVVAGVAAAGTLLAAPVYFISTRSGDKGSAGRKDDELAYEVDAKAAADAQAAAVLKAARFVVIKNSFGVLTTIGEEGYPQSRVVAPRMPEQGFNLVRLGTNKLSRKVAQIDKDGRCSLTFFDKDRFGYIQLTGDIWVDRSSEAVQKTWTSTWLMFYPEGPGPEGRFTTLQFVPTRIEVVPGISPFLKDKEMQNWLPHILVKGKDGLWHVAP